MAASTHYIRSIHTSFTAAHPHSSSAWATTASAAAQYHLNHNSSPGYQPRPAHPHHHHGYAAQGFSQSLNSHNAHMYTHHLRDLTYSASPVAAPVRQAAGASAGMGMSEQQHRPYASPRKAATTPQTRRRSVSIHMPPSYKFDPFGDEPAASEPSRSSVTPLTSSSQANRASAALSETPTIPEAEADISSAASTQPYTIHIPAAAQSDLQRYTHSSSGPRSLASNQNQGLSPAPRPLSARAPSFTPTNSSPAKSALPSITTSPPKAFSSPPTNLSKIVAGMILNRVHVPKPPRRRVSPGALAGRQYVKSCLSSVVSVEC